MAVRIIPTVAECHDTPTRCRREGGRDAAAGIYDDGSHKWFFSAAYWRLVGSLDNRLSGKFANTTHKFDTIYDDTKIAFETFIQNYKTIKPKKLQIKLLSISVVSDRNCNRSKSKFPKQRNYNNAHYDLEKDIIVINKRKNTDLNSESEEFSYLRQSKSQRFL